MLYLQQRTYNGAGIKLREALLILLLSSVFLLSAISSTYSSNWQEGLRQTIRVLPIALFPIIFGFLRKGVFNSKELLNLKRIYVFAITLGLLCVHIILFENLYLSNNSHWEIRQQIEKVTDVHGTYLSIWIGFGVLVLFSRMLFNFDFKKIVTYLALIAYFIYWQITIGARMPLIITMLLSFIYIIFQFNFKSKIVVISALLGASILFLTFSKSNIVERVERVFSFEHAFPEGDYSYKFKDISSEDIRKGIFLCSWTLTKEEPWLGYGIGDVQTYMDNCYRERINSNVYQRFHYNTHNQYFQVVLSAGIIALLLFVISLLFPLFTAFKQRDFLWFGFTLLNIACFLTENVLNRHDGVIFYSLFNALFAFDNFKIDKSSIPSTN